MVDLLHMALEPAPRVGVQHYRHALAGLDLGDVGLLDVRTDVDVIALGDHRDGV